MSGKIAYLQLTEAPSILDYMTTPVKTQQSRAIGWYAVQRVHITDWLKPHRNKQIDHSEVYSQSTAHKEDRPDTSPGQDSTHQKRDSGGEMPPLPQTDSKDAKKLKAVVRESHTILAKAQSVFPFQLFPDTINIDRHKLTIIRRQFFGIEQKVSVPLENVKNIEADLGPFFGSITITSDLFINNTQTVHFLTRNDARKIQKLVQGAVVAQAEGIDLNRIDVKQLRGMLIDLGSGHSRSM
jgi:hypothetical protein